MPSNVRPSLNWDGLPLRGAQGVVLLVGAFDIFFVLSAVLVAISVASVPLDSVGLIPALYLVAGAVALWVLTLSLHGAYVAPCMRGSRATVRPVVLGTVSAVTVVAAATWTLDLPVSKTQLALAFVLGLSLLLVSRWASCVVVRHLWARGRLERRVVVIGESTPVRDLVSALEREGRFSGLHAVATVIHASSGTGADAGSVRVLGGVGDVIETCREAGADSALVAGNWGSAEEMRRLSWELADHGIDLFMAPDVIDIAGVRMELLPTEGLPLLHVDKPRVAQAGGMAKRVMDVVLSLAAIVLLAPVALVIAVLIKVEDGGPVYFRQIRVGRRGRTFVLLKFRSMKVGAGELEADMRREQGHEGALWKMENDPRITRVGGLLRRTSLDELPQFFNVLLGQMSLVGPRPQQEWEADTYTRTVQRRLLVRPGITGLWQVSGRSDLSLDEAVRLDLYYVDNWSMPSDLTILGQTARAVLTRRGAY